MKEIQNNTLQSNSDSEVEDLMNPKDELKKKIVNLACTIRKWNEETVQVRKSVREQLQEILDLGLNEYKMQQTELRKLVEQIFRYHGISESWLRRLLPKGLKDTSKTRISYLQKQEIEKERQRLLSLRQASESQPSIEVLPSLSSSSLESQQEFKSGEVSPSYNEIVKFETSDHEARTITIENRLNEANKRIERLEVNIEQLSKPFIARANLQTSEEDIPLIAQIDPVEKVVTWIRFDKATSI